MRTIWHSLLWKEWHEHKWKLVAMAAILLAVPILCEILISEREILFEATTGALIAYAVLAGMFLSMSVAAGENSRRTMPFLQSLPVPMWRPAAVKFGWAAVTVVVPIFLVVGIVYGTCQVWDWMGVVYEMYPLHGDTINDFSWEDANWFVARIVMATLAVLSLLVWGAAAGVNRRDEVRAGAIGIVVVVGWYFLLLQLGSLLFRHQLWKQLFGGLTPDLWCTAAISAGPIGPAIATESAQRNLHQIDASHYWTVAIAAVLSHGCLIAWYLMRFGKPGWSLSYSRKPAVANVKQSAWLAPPRRSKLTAVIWKQVRETAPLALIAVAAIVGMAAWAHRPSSAYEEFHRNLLKYGGMFGFFVVIVAGIGVFLEDLKPGLHTFWRSRPVNLHQWFWVKFLTGLVIIAFALGTPVAYGWWRMVGETHRHLVTWRSVDHEQIGSAVIPLALVFLTLYCWSVAAICLVRQPIYAAVFSIASFSMVPIVVAMFRHLNSAHGWNENVLLTIFCVVLSVLSTLTAWLAVRYDWGYKG